MAKFNVEDRQTTPLINVIRLSPALREKYNAALLEDMRARPDVPAVDRAKAAFGKQTATWINGENRRYYIWDRATWRVFAHNVGGISFDVDENLSVDQAWAAFEEFRALMRGSW